MGLDIYAGPLTRYHGGAWETVVAQYAREQGIEYRVVRATEEPEDTVTDLDEIAAAVQDWQAGLSTALRPHLGMEFRWADGPSQPYLTDKPDWPGFWGLVLHAAYTVAPHLMRPIVVPKDPTPDEAYAELAATGFNCRFSQLFEVELWLPERFDFRFNAEDLVGNDIVFGSSPMLLEQLHALNAETFRASAADLARWRTEGIDEAESLESSARFGLAVMLRLAEYSVTHRVPMRLDY